MINNNYINFYNIFFLYYADLRLIDIKFENFEKIFSNDLYFINSKFSNFLNIKINNNFFCIDLLDNSNEEINYLIKFFNIYSFDFILLDLKSKDGVFYQDLNIFFSLLNELNEETGDDLYKKTLIYKDSSFLLYNGFNSILKTFRGKKDLKVSLEYINNLIQRYNLSIFYLFRIRNLFLYYYQNIIGRNNFHNLLKNNKNFLLSSKYIKLIFLDIFKARKLNKDNLIIDLFEGIVYLHLLDSRGLDILNNLKQKNIHNDNIYLWISKYYLDIGDYLNSEKELLNNKVSKNFKYYRIILFVYYLSKQKNKLINIIDELLNNGYDMGFYVKGEKYKDYKIYDFNEIISNNENLNIILDIDYDIFLELLDNTKKGNLNYIDIFFNYVKKNHNEFFLKNNDISIILKKI